MTASIYVASFEPSAGKSVLVLALVDHLAQTAGRIGYLRPVRPTTDDDRSGLVRSRLPGATAAEDVIELATTDELADLFAEGRASVLVDRALEAFGELRDRCDVVVVDGTDHTGVAGSGGRELDEMLAADLGTPVLALVQGSGRDVHGVLDAVGVAHERLVAAGATHVGTVVNRLAADVIGDVRSQLSASVPVSLVPEDPELAAPTAAEVFRGIGGTVVAGSRGRATTIAKAAVVDDDRPVTGIRVGAMSVTNLLGRLDEGVLVITPGDRLDVLLTVLAADASPSMPAVAGVVLTGGIPLDPQVHALLEGLPSQVPICTVDGDTFQTAGAVADVRGVIRPHQERKIRRALDHVAAHVDLAGIAAQVTSATVERVTPRMFEHRLMERAAGDLRHVVLPEGTDDRILRASQILHRRGVARLTLLGDVDDVHARADELSISLDGIEVRDPVSDASLGAFAAQYAEFRAHKGVSLDQARDRMSDVSYFGTMMVKLGHADGMVSGAAHTTAHTVRPAFEFVRTRPGVDVISSVFLMCLADRVLAYGDCAVIPNPTVDELADIAIASAGTAATFGIEPRVAMLSYSTGTSGTGEDVERVRAAVSLVRERAPDLAVEGPIQYDAAIEPTVAAAKLPGSSVAGRATVFVFPDLDTGNIAYKAVQRSANAVAIGPVLQGLAMPVNDLSRGCTVADVVNTVAITAVQAQESGRDVEPSS